MSPSVTASADPFGMVSPPTRLSSQITVEPFVPPGWVHDLPLLRAYIDETGDRGKVKGAASPIFGMAAVLVTPESEAVARGALRELRRDFRTPDGRPLSWKDDLKNQDRRLHAATLLSGIDGLRVVYVIADKRRLNPGTYGDDVTLLYNVVAYATLQRVLWAAKHWPEATCRVEVRYGHVKRHDHLDTHRYFQIKQAQDAPKTPFHLMSKLEWVNASSYEMSQIADLYAGFLKAAFWPSTWGDVDGAHLLRVWHQIRASERCVTTLGLQVRPDSQIGRDMPWWPCAGCTSGY